VPLKGVTRRRGGHQSEWGRSL